MTASRHAQGVLARLEEQPGSVHFIQGSVHQLALNFGAAPDLNAATRRLEALPQPSRAGPVLIELGELIRLYSKLGTAVSPRAFLDVARATRQRIRARRVEEKVRRTLERNAIKLTADAFLALQSWQEDLDRPGAARRHLDARVQLNALLAVRRVDVGESAAKLWPALCESTGQDCVVAGTLWPSLSDIAALARLNAVRSRDPEATREAARELERATVDTGRLVPVVEYILDSAVDILTQAGGLEGAASDLLENGTSLSQAGLGALGAIAGIRGLLDIDGSNATQLYQTRVRARSLRERLHPPVPPPSAEDAVSIPVVYGGSRRSYHPVRRKRVHQRTTLLRSAERGQFTLCVKDPLVLLPLDASSVRSEVRWEGAQHLPALVLCVDSSGSCGTRIAQTPYTILDSIQIAAVGLLDLLERAKGVGVVVPEVILVNFANDTLVRRGTSEHAQLILMLNQNGGTELDVGAVLAQTPGPAEIVLITDGYLATPTGPEAFSDARVVGLTVLEYVSSPDAESSSFVKAVAQSCPNGRVCRIELCNESVVAAALQRLVYEIYGLDEAAIEAATSGHGSA